MSVSEFEFWENRYQNEHIPWDLGRPTPVFQYFLKQNPGKGRNVCVLGAGRGHDALEFARHGYRVSAVEFAPTAADRIKRAAAEENLDVEVIQQDLFNLSSVFDEEFDLVLEYTTYCAITPDRRDEYVAVVAHILKPGGRLLALFFPLDGDPAVGPPYGVSRSEIETRFAHHFKIVDSKMPDESVAPRLGREILMVLERGVQPHGGGLQG